MLNRFVTKWCVGGLAVGVGLMMTQPAFANNKGVKCLQATYTKGCEKPCRPMHIKAAASAEVAAVLNIKVGVDIDMNTARVTRLKSSYRKCSQHKYKNGKCPQQSIQCGTFTWWFGSDDCPDDVIAGDIPSMTRPIKHNTCS